MKTHNRQTWIWMCGVLALTSALAWAAPPEDKGKDNAPGQEKKAEQGGGNGNGNSQAGGNGNAGGNADRGNSAAARAADRGSSNADNARADRTHPHADKVADRAADRAAHQEAKAARDTGRPSVTGRDRAKDHRTNGQEHALQLAKNLTKFDHARWSYHPFDTRPHQGNAGKVTMQSPYGFDKDSGREGRDRGRPIREAPTTTDPTPTQNPAELTTVDFNIVNAGLIELQIWLAQYIEWDQWYTEMYPAYAGWMDSTIAYYQALIADYEQRSVDLISVYDRETIDYTLTLPAGFEGSTLLVTTTLTSLSTYDDVAFGTYSGGSFDETTGYWNYDTYEYDGEHAIHYEAGQVVVADTQEVMLDGSGTFSVSYLPSQHLVGDYSGWFGSAEDGGQGFLAELSVTITDPVSGASYTTTYDRAVNLYRCPYGVVYDQATKQPIANAVVTVHDAATGAIVALDQGANPNQSNPQTTDATGRYDCKLQIGRQYYVTVQAPNYQEYKSPVFSERWHVVREDVPLEKVQSVAQR